jgi:hypothetical protein
LQDRIVQQMPIIRFAGGGAIAPHTLMQPPPALSHLTYRACCGR